MFRLMSRSNRAQARNYSALANTTWSRVNSLANKTQDLVNKTVYWSKVSLELGKYMWVKEGMSPPTVETFKKVYTQDFVNYYAKFKQYCEQPRQAIPKILALGKNDYIRGGAAVVQVLGFFSLGEIIGRRHVYGYKH